MKYFIALAVSFSLFGFQSSAQSGVSGGVSNSNRFLNAPTYNFKPNNYYKIRSSNGKYLALSDYGQLILTKDRPGDYKEYWGFLYSKNGPNEDTKWILIQSAYTGQFVTMKNGKTDAIYKGGPYGILGLSRDIIGYFDCQSFRFINSGGNGIVKICPNLQDDNNSFSTAVDAGGTTPIVLLRSSAGIASQQWEIIPAAEIAPRDNAAAYQKNLGIISAYFREHPMGNLAWDQAAGEPYHPNPVPASWLESNTTTTTTTTKQPETNDYPTTDAEKAAIAERTKLAEERRKQEEQARITRQQEEKNAKDKAEMEEANRNIQKAKEIIADALDKKEVPLSQSGFASTGWPAGFSQEGVVVYMGENFTGDSEQFTKPTQFKSFKKSRRRWFNHVNSLKVAPGWVAYAYSGDDMNGPRLEIRGEWTISQNPEYKNKITAVAVYRH